MYFNNLKSILQLDGEIHNQYLFFNPIKPNKTDEKSRFGRFFYSIHDN